jgi:hypothetical protein
VLNRFSGRLNIGLGEVHGHDCLSGFDTFHFREAL